MGDIARGVYANLEGVEPDGEIYDAKVKATSLDLIELGARMAARKADLLAARG